MSDGVVGDDAWVSTCIRCCEFDSSRGQTCVFILLIKKTKEANLPWARAGNMGWPAGLGLACPNPRVRWAGTERPVLNGLRFGQPYPGLQGYRVSPSDPSL